MAYDISGLTGLARNASAFWTCRLKCSSIQESLGHDIPSSCHLLTKINGISRYNFIPFDTNLFSN